MTKKLWQRKPQRPVTAPTQKVDPQIEQAVRSEGVWWPPSYRPAETRKED